MPSRLFAAIAGLAAAGALVAAVVQAQQLPDGPEPVAWDREACAHCHMHVGEPPFAAQLQTTGGQVLHFDDPGCLLLHQAEAKPEVHAIWFHHVHEDRWVAGEAVAFVEASPSPMGHGLGAVDAGTPAAISVAEATRQVQAEVTSGRSRP